MAENKKVWMEVEKGNFVQKQFDEPVKQDYQKYVNQQMEKIGETNGDVRRYINRCKRDGEKRKCLINPEGLF